MLFKADLGSVSGSVCQVQGVWLEPELRGRGLAAPAMAAVVQLARNLVPTVSLYVNDYNLPARATYTREWASPRSASSRRFTFDGATRVRVAAAACFASLDHSLSGCANDQPAGNRTPAVTPTPSPVATLEHANRPSPVHLAEATKPPAGQAATDQRHRGDERGSAVA